MRNNEATLVDGSAPLFIAQDRKTSISGYPLDLDSTTHKDARKHCLDAINQFK